MPVFALNPRAGYVREHEVRHGVSQDSCPVARYIGVRKNQVDQRGRKEDEARNSIHEVAHRVEVTQSLRKLESRSKQRIISPQNLDHPPRPANALANVGG